jgi:Periplasmic copper-binding protein (NosD)/Pectate lyase superfamily protein
MNRTFFCVGLTALVITAAYLWGAQADEPPTGESVATRVGKKRGSFLTVLDFGAKGDGIADDAAAMQELIESQVGSIRFPAGTYRITKTLVVDLDKVGHTSFVADGSARLVMAGPGPAIRFVGTHLTGSADPGTVGANVWDRQRMPTVEGLAIIGEHAEADGIEAQGTFQLTLRGVHIRKCRHGVRLVERNRNVLIDGCHIYENSGIGVFYDHVNLHQSNISASHISYCCGGGVVVRGGDVRNIHISGCDIEANMAANQPPTANVLLDCAEGSVGEVAITGCTIQHTKEVAGSANIRILGRGFVNRGGKRIEINSGNVTIGDNVLSDVQTNIHLVGVRGATITGNTLWQGYAHNLLVEDSLHVIVGPNMLERNPLYAYTAEGKNGVVFRGCRDCTISALHLHNVIDSEAGLTLDKCERMHVTGCTILDCAPIGLWLKDCTNSRVHGNFIHNALKAPSVAVKITGSSSNQVDDK